jgi:hypothetical protein
MAWLVVGGDEVGLRCLYCWEIRLLGLGLDGCGCGCEAGDVERSRLDGRDASV